MTALVALLARRLRAALERRLLGLSADEIRYTIDDVRAEIRATRAELLAEIAKLRVELDGMRSSFDSRPAGGAQDERGPELPQ